MKNNWYGFCWCCYPWIHGRHSLLCRFGVNDNLSISIWSSLVSEQAFDFSRSEDRMHRTADKYTMIGRSFIIFVALIMKCELCAEIRESNRREISVGGCSDISTPSIVWATDHLPPCLRLLRGVERSTDCSRWMSQETYIEPGSVRHHEAHRAQGARGPDHD